mgnify:CR=1 FL=1
MRTTCGTPNYVAPEVLENKGYDGKMADVWSIGVILYVLLAGYLPFEEATMVALFKKIKHAEFTYPPWFSEEVKEILGQILIPDPHNRLSLQEVKNCAWLRGDVIVPPPPVSNSKSYPVEDNTRDTTEETEDTERDSPEVTKPKVQDNTSVPTPTPVPTPAPVVEPVMTPAPPAPVPEPASQYIAPPQPPVVAAAPVAVIPTPVPVPQHIAPAPTPTPVVAPVPVEEEKKKKKKKFFGLF